MFFFQASIMCNNMLFVLLKSPSIEFDSAPTPRRSTTGEKTDYAFEKHNSIQGSFLVLGEVICFSFTSGSNLRDS